MSLQHIVKVTRNSRINLVGTNFVRGIRVAFDVDLLLMKSNQVHLVHQSQDQQVDQFTKCDILK